MARDETAKYTDLMPDGKARQFSFELETKSVITRPAGGQQMPGGPGTYEITGLAWSGRGKIQRVEVSVDGKTWQDAELQQAGNFFDLCSSMPDSDGTVMRRTVGVPGLYEFART